MRSSRPALCLALLLGVVLAPTSSSSRLETASASEPEQAASAAQETAPARPPRFGLAHVDLMDLHVSRRPDGGLETAERLSAADLADRYLKAQQAGSGWNRWSLYWDMVERQAGSYDWAVADAILRRDQAAGLKTLAILQGTPGFHSASQAGASRDRFGRRAIGPGAFRWPDPFGLRAEAPGDAVLPMAPPPRALDAPIFLDSSGAGTDDPAAAAQVNPGHPWARFVATAVERYRPGGDLARASSWPEGVGVRAWEIGNEPNLAHFWSGTPAQFARYLEVAYLVIEWIDPAATVVHGGIADDAEAASWYGAFLDALVARSRQTALVEAHDWYFDAAGWHWYVYPNLLVTGPTQARRLLADHGLPPKPVWVTEMGLPIWSEHPGPCWDPVSPWRGTVAEQAGFVWQALAEGIASDVEVQILFQLYDDCGNGPDSYDAFGIVRNHLGNQCWTPPEGQACWRLDPALAGQPRPAHAALALAAREMAEVELLWRPPRDANFTQRLLFYQPPDRRVQVVWNWLRAEQQVELFATGPEATIHSLDAEGRLISRQAAPAGGKHLLSLPGTTNRNNPGNQSPVLAGRPVILIERDAYGPFRATLEALPARSPSGALTLEVDAADGGTGVGEYQLYYSVDREPSSPADWQPAAEPRPWPAAPLAGIADWSFELEPGRHYWFAARARDRAGNWSDLPDRAQAETLAEADVPGTVTPSTVTPGPVTPSPEPTVQASPPPTLPGPSRTPTDSVPTATATETATGSASATPLAPARAFLPFLARAHRLAGPPSADCVGAARPLTARVLDPLERSLTPRPGARWWIDDRPPERGPIRIEAPLWQAICAFAPQFIGAEVPGFLRGPDQPWDRGLEIHLAWDPNLLVNGNFEGDAPLAGWRLTGSAPVRAVAASEAFSGRSAVVLGEDFRGQPELGGGGNSTLSQRLRLPRGSATLSGQYRIDGRTTCDPSGCAYRDRLEIILVDEDSIQRPAHYLTEAQALAEDTAGAWRHFVYDLGPWADHRVELVFNLYQPDAENPSRAWLDDLALGAPEPGGGLSGLRSGEPLLPRRLSP